MAVCYAIWLHLIPTSKKGITMPSAVCHNHTHFTPLLLGQLNFADRRYPVPSHPALTYRALCIHSAFSSTRFLDKAVD